MSAKGISKKLQAESSFQNAFDTCYRMAVDGGFRAIKIKTISEFAEEYISRYPSKELAAKKLISNQVANTGISGLLTSLGNNLTKEISSKFDIVSVLFIQIRMVAAIAQIGGYDVRDDEVLIQIRSCLLTNTIVDTTKISGVKILEKTLMQLINKIPIERIRAINRTAGQTLITKRATVKKGIINLVDLIPIIIGATVAGIDAASTKYIANRAYKIFIENEH